MVTRRGMLGFIALIVPAFSFTPALGAETTVKVTLWDKGPGALDGMGTMAPMGMHMEGEAMRAGMAMVGIDIDRTQVPAGAVTFDVTNASQDMQHEMLVIPIPDASADLPYLPDENRIDEEAAHDLGEVAELDPGASGSLTLPLEPGTYMLVCNIPGHYVMGMWTLIEVTG